MGGKNIGWKQKIFCTILGLIRKKKLIEIEQEAWRSINALLEDQERGYIKAIVEKDKTIGEKDIALG